MEAILGFALGNLLGLRGTKGIRVWQSNGKIYKEAKFKPRT